MLTGTVREFVHRFNMLYKTFSAAVYGIDASIIEVEVDASGVKLNEVHFHTRRPARCRRP